MELGCCCLRVSDPRTEVPFWCSVSRGNYVLLSWHVDDGCGTEGSWGGFEWSECHWAVVRTCRKSASFGLTRSGRPIGVLSYLQVDQNRTHCHRSTRLSTVRPGLREGSNRHAYGRYHMPAAGPGPNCRELPACPIQTPTVIIQANHGQRTEGPHQRRMQARTRDTRDPQPTSCHPI